eukprot:scaffold23217_cov104-Phaeocystis_antarctica.AAC.1
MSTIHPSLNNTSLPRSHWVGQAYGGARSLAPVWVSLPFRQFRSLGLLLSLRTSRGARARTMSARAMTTLMQTTMTSGEDGSRRGCARRG